MDQPPDPESLAGRPFLLREAEPLGVSRNRLRTRQFRHPTRSVYVKASLEPDFELTAQTWMLVLPEDAALYGQTAAEWHGLAVPPSEDFHIIVPAGGAVPVRRPGLVPHEGLGEHEWRMWRGMRVSIPEQIFLQLAVSLSRDQLVIAGDGMVRNKLVTPDGLQTAAAAAYRRRGAVRARKAAALVRPRVDSPPETRVRLILVDGGLPCPETGIDVFDEHGGWIGRPDLAYLVLKLALQYEGDLHRTEKKRWRADIRRDEVLLDHGWDVVRITGDDLNHKAALRDRVLLRMQRQAVRLDVPPPARRPSLF